MVTGAVLLGVISVVAVSDMLIALYLRSLAERVDSGETISRNVDPERARRMASVLLLGAPVIWLVVVLISFGVVPSGIEPIRF